jgi:hypothetical protein
MPKRHRNRTMKGGFWDSLTQGFSSAWEKTKNAASSATSGLTGSTSTTSYAPTSYAPTSYAPTPTTSSQPTTPSTYGGRTKRRRMRGGFKGNVSTTGLAAHAASFSGPYAQPHNLVGGRTKRRHNSKHKRSKSYKHRR